MFMRVLSVMGARLRPLSELDTSAVSARTMTYASNVKSSKCTLIPSSRYTPLMMYHNLCSVVWMMIRMLLLVSRSKPSAHHLANLEDNHLSITGEVLIIEVVHGAEIHVEEVAEVVVAASAEWPTTSWTLSMSTWKMLTVKVNLLKISVRNGDKREPSSSSIQLRYYLVSQVRSSLLKLRFKIRPSGHGREAAT